jgi:hypothetical protein
MKRYLLLALLLLAGALLGRVLLQPAPPPPAPAAIEEVRPGREALLYFGAPDGSHLSSETREIPFCGSEDDCLRAIVQALIDGPGGELVPILPPQTVLRALRVEAATATLDFSRTLISGHSGGSLAELFTVYGLTNTVVVNFPHIRQLRLLVEGQELETLKGHVDLREPLSADFTLTRPPVEAPGRTQL